MPTIALVDDDRNIVTSVAIALEAEGYRITTYTDGVSALDGFKTTLPDLCHPRYQNAPHGRNGDAAAFAPKLRPASDLSHLEGRANRRNVRPENGRRRIHP